MRSGGSEPRRWDSRMMHVESSLTRGGIRVITAEIPHVESVAAGLWVGVGSRHEPGKLGGISHFIEHLLFKGTRKRSAREISEAIEGRGGYLNAFTSEEATCYYARVSREHLDIAADVLADMYQRSRLAPDDIAKERDVIIEEIMMYRDQPRHLVQETLVDMLWKDHPLGRPISGTPETLRRMDRAALGGFIARYYRPGHTIAAFSGKVNHAECRRLVERHLGALPAGRAVPGFPPVTRSVPQARTGFLSKDVEQVQLALGLRLFGYRDERRHALKLLNVILGENMSSRLFQSVREKHGLAYSIQSYAQLFHESGALCVTAGVDRARTAAALRLILREIRRLKERRVGAEELARSKDYIIGQIRLGLESTSQQMMWVGENLLTRGRFISPESVIARIQACGPEDIRRVAAETLTARRLSLALVGPDLDEPFQRRVDSELAWL